MVRAFLPQSFPSNLETNTDRSPQGLGQIPPVPPTIDKELIEEVATVFDNLIYDIDGATDTGQVDILGG